MLKRLTETPGMLLLAHPCSSLTLGLLIFGGGAIPNLEMEQSVQADSLTLLLSVEEWSSSLNDYFW